MRRSGSTDWLPSRLLPTALRAAADRPETLHRPARTMAKSCHRCRLAMEDSAESCIKCGGELSDWSSELAPMRPPDRFDRRPDAGVLLVSFLSAAVAAALIWALSGNS